MIEKKAYIGARIFDGADEHFGAALVTEKKEILKIVPQEDVSSDYEIISLNQGIICPGFVDIQVNGGGGCLLNEAPSLQSLEKICERPPVEACNVTARYHMFVLHHDIMNCKPLHLTTIVVIAKHISPRSQYRVHPMTISKQF